MANLIASTTLAPDNGATVSSAWGILEPGESVSYSITWVAGATSDVRFQKSDSPNSYWENIVALTDVSDGTQDVSGAVFKNTTRGRLYIKFEVEETDGASSDEQITVEALTVSDNIEAGDVRSPNDEVLVDQETEFRRFYTRLGLGVNAAGTNDPLASSAASQTMARFIFDLDHADTYGFYTRSYIRTAAISADAARIYATVEDVDAATVRGLHCSLSFGDTGTVTGLGCAAEFTVHVHNEGDMTGHVYGVKSAIHSDAADSDTDGAVFAFFAAVNQGLGTGATGTNAVDDDAYLFHLDGFAIADDHMVDTAATAYDGSDFTHGIKIRVGSTDLWLLASSVNPKAT